MLLIRAYSDWSVCLSVCHSSLKEMVKSILQFLVHVVVMVTLGIIFDGCHLIQKCNWTENCTFKMLLV